MAEVELSVVIGQLRDVFREALDGPAHRWSYFTDQGPEAGLFGTLAKLGALDASRVVGTGGTPIAAHVFHVTFAFDASAAWIRGDRTPRRWQDSWSVSTVDDTAWAQLVTDLHRGYEDLSVAIQSHGASSEEAIGGALGALAHVAYHLGAIRQKAALLRAADAP